MIPWRGPDTPFTVLFDHPDAEGLPLPPDAASHYLPWHIPRMLERPWVYVNFVASHDGRVSFNLPDAMGGGAISDFNPNDQWLMGLLRARADAVIVGDNTLRQEPRHLWTPEFIYPQEPAFMDLRRAEERPDTPLQVIVTLSGQVPVDAGIFHRSNLQVLIAGTDDGIATAQALLADRSHIAYLALGRDAVDLDALIHQLATRFSARTLLCEGGPTLYGSLVQAGLVDEEFLTLSPLVIGNPPGAHARPSLVEGVAFTPEDAPRLQLASALRAGDHLFLRSRYPRAPRSR